VWKYGLDLSGSGQCSVADSSEHGNEPCYFLNAENFLPTE